MVRRNSPKDSSGHQQLVDLARGYAEHMMRNAGGVRPALLANTDAGIILYLPESMGDERAKQNFSNTTRLIAVAYRATAVVFVMESWARFARPGRPLHSTPPSQSPDREECVVISVETGHQQTTQMLMIQRDRAGKFVGFARPEVPEVAGIQGQFAQIMPPKPPGEKDATMQAVVKKPAEYSRGNPQPRFSQIIGMETEANFSFDAQIIIAGRADL